MYSFLVTGDSSWPCSEGTKFLILLWLGVACSRLVLLSACCALPHSGLVWWSLTAQLSVLSGSATCPCAFTTDTLVDDDSFGHASSACTPSSCDCLWESAAVSAATAAWRSASFSAQCALLGGLLTAQYASLWLRVWSSDTRGWQFLDSLSMAGSCS